MYVQVCWTNSRYYYIKDFMLDSLIEAGVIARFQRRSGWVTIGVDPVRSGNQPCTYIGEERRTSERHFAADSPALARSVRG